VDPLSHWDVLSVGPTGSVNPLSIPSSVVTTIYTEDFNSINAPLGHFNGGPNGQSTARHDLVYGADLMTGWTKSSSFTNDIHCVDTANTWSGGVVSTNPQNWGIMIYATTIITQSDGIVGSNTIGTQYSIDFLAAGAVYQITSQVNNGSNDKLLVEVLRALDSAVLHSFNHIPAAPVGVGNLGLLPVSFAYTGDGSGNIKFRIGSGNPGQGRFQGTIDDLSLSRLSN
jgi:hypothetical protein